MSSPFDDLALQSLRFLQRFVLQAAQFVFGHRLPKLFDDMFAPLKRITDLSDQTGQPFEYQDRLESLTRRQQEIADALDLTKGQASGQLSADSSTETVAAEVDAQCLKESFDGG